MLTLTRKETLDDKVERALGGLANEIIDDVIDFACRLAKHRGSNSLHRDDVRLAFSRRLKVRMPTKASTSSSAAASSAATTTAALGIVAGATTAASTQNYKANLTLVKRAQDNFILASSAASKALNR